MATDSTHLQAGETDIDSGSDMDLDRPARGSVQLAAATDAVVQVKIPQGEGRQVMVIPVKPGETIKLPTDSPDGLLAKLGADGNLSIVVDGRTIILKGYAEANEKAPIKVVTNDGDVVDVTDVLAGTLPGLDIQTAAGPAAGANAAGPQGDTAQGSGIFVAFAAGPLLPGLLAEGVLDPTALGYKLIDDEPRQFVEDEEDEEDKGPSGVTIESQDVNEDDLLGSHSTERYEENVGFPEFIKVFGDSGNDPFDGEDIDDGNDGVPDQDREPLIVTANLTVDFGGDVPGKLLLDASLLPTGLTSGDEPIIYEVVPGGGGSGPAVVGFVDDGDGKAGPGDRIIFTVEVAEENSNGTFNLTFRLFDNFDNAAPGSLLGANEQDLALLFKVIAEDSNGTQLSGTWNVGVRDDIPFFGEVVEDGGLIIVPSPDSLVLDETLGGDLDADDKEGAPWNGEAVLIINSYLPQFIAISEAAADEAGITLDPSIIAKYEILADQAANESGVTIKQLLVSFGADGPSQESENDPSARHSVYRTLSGENPQQFGFGTVERPFELFMVKSGTTGTPTDGDATVADQATNATAIWEGVEYPVFLSQFGSQLVYGYIEPTGDAAGYMLPAFIVSITDNGQVSLIQILPIGHAIDGSTPESHDDGFTIFGADGITPLVYVRATDYDGDHAILPLTIGFQDDGPRITVLDTTLAIVADETVGGDGKDVDDPDFAYPKDGPAIENDEDLVGLPDALKDIGKAIGAATADASTLFSIDFGVDGGALTGSEAYSLNILDGNIGLNDTETGHQIVLVRNEETGVIEGRVDDKNAGTEDLVAFALTIDANGIISMAQYRAVDHLDDEDSAFDEAAFIGTLKLEVVVTATDADGDTVTASKDLGGFIGFDDDGPTAKDDEDSVTEDGPSIATGNVVTGEDGGLGKDDNGTDGVADELGSDGFGSIAWSGESKGVIEGVSGTLFVDADGNYRYELDNSKVQFLEQGQISKETFSYTVVDGDGDEDVATLVITIKGTDEPDPATGKLNVEGCVFEDLQPNQFEGDSTPLPEALTILFTPSDNETVTAAFLNIPTGWQVQVWDVGGATEVALLNADPNADISSYINDVLSGTYELRPVPPANSDVDASFSLALHIEDPESGLTNILTDNFTVFVDAVADLPANVTISVTDNGIDDGKDSDKANNQQFGENETGAVSVTANFSDTDGSEVHTVTLDLGSTDFQFDDPSVAGITYTGAGTGTFTYLFNGTPYLINFEFADGTMTLTIPAAVESFAKTFDINHTGKDAFDSSEFVLTAKADENPATDGGCGPSGVDLDDEGKAGDNDAEVSVSPSQPNILNGDFITNTNVQKQLALVSFVDTQDPLRAFAQIIVRGSQGQQGAILADAGFLIDALHEHLVSMEATAGTKVIVTDFSLEGVVIVGQGNAQLEVNDKDDGSSEATGLVQLITPGTEGGTTQPFEYADDDASAGAHTLADPNAGNSGADYVFGGSGADTINGASGSNVLNGGDILNAANNGADTINGGIGTDLMVFDPLDTLDGNAGFDIVRVDAGAIYNTMTAEALTLPAGLTNATVDMRDAKISDVESILITEENAASAAVGTKVILNASDVIDFTDSSKDADSVDADTLYIIGSKGDSLELHLDAGVTIDSSAPINDPVRGMTFTQYNLSNGGHLVVDTDVTVTTV
jgi:VCBS repeat-containing protein